MMLFVLLLVAVLHESNVHGTSACERHYKIGCFKAGLTETKLILNDRAGEHPKLDWNDLAGSIRSLVCRCSKKAKLNNYKYFAIRFYGECWAGRDARKIGNMDPKTRSTNCISDVKPIKKCNDKDQKLCVGKAGTEYIYAISQDGGYSQWSAFSACSAKCGQGSMSRERTCTKPAPKWSGKGCSALGPSKESKPCKVKDCPVNGGYTNWSPYTSCTLSCGGGERSRTRTCSKPSPQYGGTDCSRSGQAKQIERCNTKECPVVTNLAFDRPSAQSSIMPWGSCKNNLCGPSYANNGNTGGVMAITRGDSKKGMEWWSVDLGHLAKINRIVLYLDRWSFKKGYYTHVVVLTRKRNTGKWMVCKDLGKPEKLHVNVVCNRETVATYVKVAILDKKPLYLPEVRVYGTYMNGMRNLAYHRPSSQSSMMPWGSCRYSSCGPSGANDGHIQGSMAITRGDSKVEWWKVDLGDLAKISKIILYLDLWSFNKGYDAHIVVSTRRTNTGRWIVCKDLGKLEKIYVEVVCDRPTVATYVKVAIPGKKPLYLPEVKVYGTYVSGMSNIAFRRPSSQSSIMKSGYCQHHSCGPSNANDGEVRNIIGSVAVTGGYSKAQWWSVDLGDLAKINRIQLYLVQLDWIWSKPKVYYTHVVVYTRKTNTGEWSVCKDLGKPQRTPVNVVVCNRPTVAKYVKVAILDKRPLYLPEVKVYGYYV